MKVKFQTLDVRRSELSTVRVTVPAWEVSLLQAIHRPANVAMVGESQRELDEVPEASTEFDRLAKRYPVEVRDDGSRGMPIVEAVYGQFQPGIMNLQRAIDAAAA